MQESPAPGTWTIVDTRVLRRAMAQVSARQWGPDSVPQYSIRVGTAQLLEDGTTRISSHMSIYDVDDARTLLLELSEKYREERERQRASSGEPTREERRAGRPGLSRQYRQGPGR